MRVSTAEVGIYRRKEESTLSTKKAIKKKKNENTLSTKKAIKNKRNKLSFLVEGLFSFLFLLSCFLL